MEMHFVFMQKASPLVTPGLELAFNHRVDSLNLNPKIIWCLVKNGFVKLANFDGYNNGDLVKLCCFSLKDIEAIRLSLINVVSTKMITLSSFPRPFYEGLKVEVEIIPLVDLGLSVRASNIIRRNRIFTVGTLSYSFISGIAKIKNLGAKTFTELYLHLALVDLGVHPSLPHIFPVTDENSILIKESPKLTSGDPASKIFAKDSINIKQAIPSYSSRLEAGGIATLGQFLRLGKQECTKFGIRNRELNTIYGDLSLLIEDKFRVWKFVPTGKHLSQIRKQQLLNGNYKILSSLIFLPISTLELSERAGNCLKNSSIERIGELLACSVYDLTRIRFMGIKTFVEVIVALTLYINDLIEYEEEVQTYESKLLKECISSKAKEICEKQASFLGAILTNDFRFRVSFSGNPIPLAVAINTIYSPSPRFIASIEDALKKIDEWVQSYPGISSELEALLGELSSREITILKKRWGWDGHGKKTLQEVGDFMGVTRERIRQIETRATKGVEARLKSKTCFIFGVHYLENEIKKSGGWIFHEQLAGKMIAQKLISFQEELTALANLSGTPFGKNILFHFDRDLEVWFLNEDDFKKVVKAAKLIKKVLLRNGVVNVKGLFHLLEEEELSFSNEQLVSIAKQMFPEYDLGNGWFMKPFDLGKRWNPLLRRIYRMLQVCSQLSLKDIYKALRRIRRVEVVPPPEILSKIISLDSSLILEGDAVRFVSKSAKDANLLSDAEKKAISLIDDMGPIMPTAELQNKLVDMNVNSVTAQLAIYGSGLFLLIGEGLVCKVGARFGLSDVRAAMRRQEKRGKVVRAISYNSDGKIRLEYKLNAATLRNGLLPVRGKKLGLVGLWKGRDTGENNYILKVGDYYISRAGKWFRAEKFYEDTAITITFDPRTKTALLEVLNNKESG